MLVPVFYQPYPSVVLTNELTANTHRLLSPTFYSSFLCSFRLELSRQASHIAYFFSSRISKINWSSALFLPSPMLFVFHTSKISLYIYTLSPVNPPPVISINLTLIITQVALFFQILKGFQVYLPSAMLLPFLAMQQTFSFLHHSPHPGLHTRQQLRVKALTYLHHLTSYWNTNYPVLQGFMF